jgi:hypothetical protein
MIWVKIFLGTNFRGNYFAEIKNFTKTFLRKLLLGTCSRGNDFASIKNFRQK